MAHTTLFVLSLLALAGALQPPIRAVRLSVSGTQKSPVRAKHLAMSEADKRKTVAKARRAVLSEGKGGMTPRSTKKRRSEQKAPPSGKGFGKPAGGLNFDRVPGPNTECACGNGQTYGDCACSALHQGAMAKNPADLVRARYTAYKYRLPDFLMQTTDPEGTEWDSDSAAWKRGLLGFCDDFEFQTLSVGDMREGSGSVASAGAEGDASVEAAALAQVDFRADFAQKGTLNLMVLKETSTFRRDEHGRWLYAQGEVDYEAQSVVLTEEEKQRLHEKLKEQQALES